MSDNRRGKGAVWALGAMSGTSLDGVDAAMILTDGCDVFEFGKGGYRAYVEGERETIRKALGPVGSSAEVEPAAEVIETVHAALLSGFAGAEIVGFHGQTIHHDPDRGVTVQIGDGAVLAEILGRPVVWDFRSSDVEMGGQGAPLAPFWHHALARWIGAVEPIVFLNLGGVGNLTWVDPGIADPAAQGALLAFDTGPANAPIDDEMRRRFGVAFDGDGRKAASGRAAEGVLERMLEGGYFLRVPPKSLDRNDFAFLSQEVHDLSGEDAIATLTAAAAAAVVKGIEHCPRPPRRVLVSGGGRKNPVLMEMLRAGLGVPVAPVEEVGLDGDMLEAQAFAYLAVRVSRGLPTSAPGTTGVAAPVGGGRISRPGSTPVEMRRA